MGYELPTWLEWLGWVVGSDWPAGDEDAMRRIADAWTAMGTACDTAGDDGDNTVDVLITALDAADGRAFDTLWSSYSGGDDAYLSKLSTACGELAKQCNGLADEIEYAKYVFVVMLAMLAADIILAAATAAETFGASLAQVAAEEVMIQLTIRQIARMVLEKIAARVAEKAGEFSVRQLATGGAKSIAKGMAPDAIAQTAMLAKGDRSEWNLGNTRDSLASSVAGASLGAGADTLLAKTGLTRAAGDHLTAHLGLNAAKGAATGAATPFVAGQVTGKDATGHDIAEGAVAGANGSVLGFAHDTTKDYAEQYSRGQSTADTPPAGPPDTHLAAAPDEAPPTARHTIPDDAPSGTDPHGTANNTGGVLPGGAASGRRTDPTAGAAAGRAGSASRRAGSGQGHDSADAHRTGAAQRGTPNPGAGSNRRVDDRAAGHRTTDHSTAEHRTAEHGGVLGAGAVGPEPEPDPGQLAGDVDTANADRPTQRDPWTVTPDGGGDADTDGADGAAAGTANPDPSDSDTQDSDTQDSDTQDSDTQDSDTEDPDTGGFTYIQAVLNVGPRARRASPDRDERGPRDERSPAPQPDQPTPPAGARPPAPHPVERTALDAKPPTPRSDRRTPPRPAKPREPHACEPTRRNTTTSAAHPDKPTPRDPMPPAPNHDEPTPQDPTMPGPRTGEPTPRDARTPTRRDERERSDSPAAKPGRGAARRP